MEGMVNAVEDVNVAMEAEMVEEEEMAITEEDLPINEAEGC